MQYHFNFVGTDARIGPFTSVDRRAQRVDVGIDPYKIVITIPIEIGLLRVCSSPICYF